jgi:hypothetical protein
MMDITKRLQQLEERVSKLENRENPFEAMKSERPRGTDGFMVSHCMKEDFLESNPGADTSNISCSCPKCK